MNSLKLAAAIALIFPVLAWADTNWLITPQEVSQETAWVEDHPSAMRLSAKPPTPGSPDIDLLAPSNLNDPIKAPFPIHLVFKAKDGAVIKPESFRILYGFLKLDITDRLTGHAKVGPDGIEVASADIPPGSHHLITRVSDDRGRQGETDFDFTVK